MFSMNKIFFAATLLLALTLALATGAPVRAGQLTDSVTVGGWIRADYGVGDRYPEEAGEDSLGVSQAALLTHWSKDNLEAVLLLGGTDLASDDSDGDIGIKDAFLVWKEIGGSALTLSVGAQPLLFGLKPNGFPGDRSLQPSLEYGGAGGFAVSQQAGPSIIASAAAGKWVTLRGGLFDTSSSTAAYHQQTGLGGIEGSSLTKNYFAQARFGAPDNGVGFYGTIGYEGRYVGDAVDSTEPILDIGLGVRYQRFDFSVELIQLSETLVGTADDETYTLAELTVMPMDRLSLYLDFAMADQTEAETLRLGMKFQIHENFLFVLEYSDDEPGGSGPSINSFDSRLEMKF